MSPRIYKDDFWKQLEDFADEHQELVCPDIKDYDSDESVESFRSIREDYSDADMERASEQVRA
jgi:hypothetical protein